MSSPWIRNALGALAAVVLAVVVAFTFVISGDGTEVDQTVVANPDTTLSSATVTPETTVAPETTSPVAEDSISDQIQQIAAQFQSAVNSKDASVVGDLSPTTNEDTLDFLIGGGPYDTLECYPFDGRDECRITAGGIADFTFVVDVGSALVTEVTYVGGE